MVRKLRHRQKRKKPQKYRNLFSMCDKKFKEYEAEGCDIYFNKKDHLWTLYEYETGAFKIPEYACDGMIYGGCTGEFYGDDPQCWASVENGLMIPKEERRAG